MKTYKKPAITIVECDYTNVICTSTIVDETGIGTGYGPNGGRSRGMDDDD